MRSRSAAGSNFNLTAERDAMPTPTLYAITPGADAGTLAVTQAWAQANNELPAGLKQLLQTPWRGGTLLVGADAAGKLALAQLADTAPFVQPLPQQLDLGGPCDILSSFTLGGQVYLIAYTAKTGAVSFFALQDNLTPLGPTHTRGRDRRQRPPAGRCFNR